MVHSLKTRIPEPVWDDRRLEAVEYSEMDHRDVNAQFVADLISGGTVGPDVYDVGAGTALIAIELCEQAEAVRVMAIDGEIEMLEIARHEIDAAGLIDRITPAHADLVTMADFAGESADTIISNTVLHHLDDPSLFFPALLAVLKPGGRLFVRDLARPQDEAEFDSLMNQHAASGSEHAIKMFGDSLRAALRLDEIQAIAANHGISADCLKMTSDRHWTLDWTKPEAA